MLAPTPALIAFEQRFQREAFATLTFADALTWYAALWAHARTLDPDVGAQWREDLEPDLAIARAVNGLSPAA